MDVKLLTEFYFEFISLKVGCTGVSESTLVKMSHCWKSYVMAQIIIVIQSLHYSHTPRKDVDEVTYQIICRPLCLLDSSAWVVK